MPHIDPNAPQPTIDLPPIFPPATPGAFPTRGPVLGPIGTPTQPQIPGSEAERLERDAALFICSFGVEPGTGPSCADLLGSLPVSATPVFNPVIPPGVDVSEVLPPGIAVDPITRTIVSVARILQSVFQTGPLAQPVFDVRGGGGSALPQTFPWAAVSDHAAAAA